MLTRLHEPERKDLKGDQDCLMKSFIICMKISETMKLRRVRWAELDSHMVEMRNACTIFAEQYHLGVLTRIVETYILRKLG